MHITSWTAFLLLATAAIPARADLIVLKDGRTLSGTMLRRGDDALIQLDNGTQVRIKPDDVVRTTLTTKITPAEAANAEWTRASALIKQSNDLPTIIDLHQKFLAKFPDQPMSDTVKGSLTQYQKLLAQNGVKFRGRWMPAAQVDVTLRQWESTAAPAVALYKAGKLQPALDAAKRIIARDADNPKALTIAGLAQYRLNNSAPAMDYFQTLAEADPADLLAENNLAVILFSEKRQPESLLHYTRALQAVPPNRLVLDNIAEALAAYSGSTDALTYVKLLRQYQQAETRMAAQMATQGLYRYGSTWVTQPQLDRLNANLQSIKASMARLQSQYSSSQHESLTIADQIKQATDDYNNTLLSLEYLNSGIFLNGGDPGLILRRNALLADLERSRQQRAVLEARRDAVVAGTPEMFAQAAALKTALAAAQRSQFTGIQRIMDLGEADNPPPPTVVALPPLPAPPQPLLVQAPPPQVIVPAEDPYQRIYNVGDNAFIPIFVPPPNRMRHDHNDHDHDNSTSPIAPIDPKIAPIPSPVPPLFPKNKPTTAPI